MNPIHNLISYFHTYILPSNLQRSFSVSCTSYLTTAYFGRIPVPSFICESILSVPHACTWCQFSKLTQCFSKIYFTTDHNVYLILPNGVNPSGFPNRILNAFFISPIRGTSLSLVDLFTVDGVANGVLEDNGRDTQYPNRVVEPRILK
jgi:hypothetical protein